MPSPNELFIPCHAKVNLALSVGAPDPARNNYHPIASWMVRLDFHDDLTLAPLDSAGPSAFDIDWAPDAPSPSPIDWPIEKDLIFKAHKLIEGHVGRTLPIRAMLRKRIPVGAGLAGGSTDGAAMLTGLDQLFDLKIPPDQLLALAARLGSDVAFFLGPPSAIITDLGQIISPAPRVAPIHMVLIMPPFGCPTAGVYQTFDRVSPAAQVNEPRVRRLAAETPLSHDGPFNDLAAPACIIQPRLSELIRQCGYIAGAMVHITGSGSTLFTLTDTPQAAERTARLIRDRMGMAALPAHTLI